MVDFNDIPIGIPEIQGDRYEPVGVMMSRVDAPVTADIGLGLEILPAPRDEMLSVYAPAGDPSVYAPGLLDVLFTFTAPVTEVSLRMDRAVNETPDLMALSALSFDPQTGLYFVVDAAFGWDNTRDTLTVSSDTPFLFALYQATTEQEAYDDLMFVAAPIPAPAAFAALAMVGGLAARRRR